MELRGFQISLFESADSVPHALVSAFVLAGPLHEAQEERLFVIFDEISVWNVQIGAARKHNLQTYRSCNFLVRIFAGIFGKLGRYPR